MFLIYCPHCGEERDEQEFHHAGEPYIVRPQDPDNASDEEWGDYVFFRENPKGWIWEQWTHNSGCRKMVVVKRNNVTNEIAATYTLAEGKPLFLADREQEQSV